MYDQMLEDDMPERFHELPPERQAIIVKWIMENLRPRKRTLYDWTSYGLKHLMEWEIGRCCTSGEFKGAMLHCGYRPKDPGEVNWFFGISKRSPAFRPNANERRKAR